MTAAMTHLEPVVHGVPALRAIGDATTVDLPAAQRAVADLLRALGRDPSTEHLRDTPRRVARAFAELLAPEPFTFTTSRTTRATTSWYSSRTSPSTPCASTICSPSSASRMLPTCRRPHRRAVEAGPRGTALRQRPTGARATDPAGRRLPRRLPARQGRRCGHRSRAPVHVRPRRPGARVPDRDLVPARQAARRRSLAAGVPVARPANNVTASVPGPGSVLVAGGTGRLGVAVLTSLLDADSQVTTTWLVGAERDAVAQRLGGRVGLSLLRADLMDPASVQTVSRPDGLWIGHRSGHRRELRADQHCRQPARGSAGRRLLQPAAGQRHAGWPAHARRERWPEPSRPSGQE